MIVVGGVPGAGKSTLLRAHAGPGVVVLDPDDLRPVLRRRGLVHAVHQLLVWAAALAGPRILRGRTVLIHDTATRRRRREAFLALARARGWDVDLLLVDVTRLQAVTGQVQRGRLVAPGSFDRHWRRWERWRTRGVGDAIVCPRDHADAVLRELLEMDEEPLALAS
ncbi:hypothetical protein GCM10027425_14860 [Alteromonas gracilis]